MTDNNVIPLRTIHCAVQLLIRPDDHDSSALTAIGNAVADRRNTKRACPNGCRHVEQVLDHRTNPDQLVHVIHALAETLAHNQTTTDERNGRQQSLL